MSSPRGSVEKAPKNGHHDDPLRHHSPEGEVLMGTSVRSQLSAWHANRGERSVASSILPRPHTAKDASKNPFKFLRQLTLMQWLLFFSGWFCWTCDGFDYFAVSVTMHDLGHYFEKTPNQISLAITLTLLFRSLGAVIFGVLADRYGRKWTLVINTLLICIFELASGFVQTYQQFLGIRAIFGIVMGGIWGQAAATALENVPAGARGLLSGVVQQGYAVGYLLAAVINLTVAQTSKYHWRTVYFFGAGFSLLAAIFRACLPESEQYLRARAAAVDEGISGKEAARRFGRSVIDMLKTNWIRCIWAVCFMAGMNFFSHGSQDMYPTYLQTTKGLSARATSKVTIISNCGAIAGGMIGGYMSQYCGRRLTVIILCCWTAAWIPLWILPNNFGGLAAGGFFVQSGVQGAWGVVPIYLSEISPSAFRASFAGIAYQLGNMASAGSAQIVATGGQNIKLKGSNTPDYATIQGIFIGCVIGWLLIMSVIGPDADGAHFEHAKVAFESGAGAQRAVVEPDYDNHHAHDSHLAHSRSREKAPAQV